MKKGILVAFEGLDKTGKTTQSKILNKTLNSLLIPSQLIHFPQRNSITGKIIDEYLRNLSVKLEPEVSHLLFSANRWQTKQAMLQILKKGDVLIVDRYVWSGIAYSRALGVNREWSKYADTGLPLPDLIVYMKNQKCCLNEKRPQFGKQIYQNKQFQAKVNDQYDLLVQQNASQPIELRIDIKQVDADRPLEENSHTILKAVQKMLQKKQTQL